MGIDFKNAKKTLIIIYMSIAIAIIFIATCVPLNKNETFNNDNRGANNPITTKESQDGITINPSLNQTNDKTYITGENVSYNDPKYILACVFGLSTIYFLFQNGTKRRMLELVTLSVKNTEPHIAKQVKQEIERTCIRNNTRSGLNNKDKKRLRKFTEKHKTFAR